jgi:hypothetical protein
LRHNKNNMGNFDKNFNTMSGFIKVMLVIVILIMAITWGYRISRIANAKGDLYEITIATYGNTMPDVYFATEYAERDGCVHFKDEFGFEHKACGAYQIKKW